MSSKPEQAKRLPAPQADPDVNQDQDNKALEQRYSLLCNLRMELQDFREVLVSIRKGEAAITEHTDYFQNTKQAVDALKKDLETQEKMVEEFNPLEASDRVRRVCDLCEQISDNPLLKHPEAQLDAQKQSRYLNTLEQLIHKIEVTVGFETIPYRLSQWLQVGGPGYYVPFHVIFEDELPIYEDRVKFLTIQAIEPNTLPGGLIDVANGVIYRYDTRASVQRQTIVKLVLLFIISISLIILAGSGKLLISNWPLDPTDMPKLLIGWLAVLVGVSIHVAVEALKRSRSQGALPFVMVIDDVGKVLNARQGQIVGKLIMAFIGFFAFVFFSAQTMATVTPLNAFLVGYSLDSVLDIFGKRLDQQATAFNTQLKQQVGLESEN